MARDDPQPQDQEIVGKDPWLEMAKSAYLSSTSYLDNNFRKQWEDNIRHFQGKHHKGSKYLSGAYKYRSKVFRPKTRSAIRGNEAAASAAFFANRDVVSIEPQNHMDEYQKASAEIMQELLQYRLTKTIPWFLTLIGAYQETQVIGVVASKQSWRFERQNGNVKHDGPQVELWPVENIRIHPASKWTDPVNSSPYLQAIVPMYAMDVQAMMEETNAKTGAPKWKHYDDGELKAARRSIYDSTRQVREEDREDKYDQNAARPLDPFDIIWTIENFMRKDGEDYVYWTLGTEKILTDPVPIEQVYFTGKRPFVIGYCLIETHKFMPSGPAEIGKPIQKELNEIVNQRLDNVKFVLNKRWFAKRGGQVDIRMLKRNVAGGIVLMNNPKEDVIGQDFPDVTRSSYEEQDRLNVDYDELTGNFSTGTVQTQRQLNETVGGMKMLRSSMGAMAEYSLKTFAETWVEPVLEQLVHLEQMYETDAVVLTLAAEKAQVFQKYGINTITDDLLNQELTTTVNVGLGATDPIMKTQNFVFGLEAIIKVLSLPPEVRGTLSITEIVKEIFGRMGWKDGERFLAQELGQDPEKMQMAQLIQALQGMLQQMQQQLEQKLDEQANKLRIAEIKEEGQDRRKAADIKADFVKLLVEPQDTGAEAASE